MKTNRSTRTRRLAVCLLAATAALTATALTPVESDSVLYMKQEEKVARDVYRALAARWDHATFRNIAISEQRHMDAIDGLIARYRLTDSTPTEPGRFSIPELQKLHDDLVARGSASLVEALRVGVLVEETDIADLNAALGLVTDPVIQRVFGNLLRGSGQHLSAFNAALGTVDADGTVIADPTLCPRNGACAMGNGGRGPGQAAAKGSRRGRCGAGATATDPCPGPCANGETCPMGAGTGDCPKANPATPSMPTPPTRGGRR